MSNFIIIHQFKLKITLIRPQNLLKFRHQEGLQATRKRQRISRQLVPAIRLVRGWGGGGD